VRQNDITDSVVIMMMVFGQLGSASIIIFMTNIQRTVKLLLT